MSIDNYRDRYENIAFTLHDDGVLEVRLHTRGGPLAWSAAAHRDLGPACRHFGHDPDVEVVLLSGTGDRFCTHIDHESFRDSRPMTLWAEGKELLQALVDIEMPVVGVVNGPATIHAEILVLSDIVVASETATFADEAHFVNGVVPGDGVHLIWPELLGRNRGRHFLITGREMSATEAFNLGVVAEVVPAADAHGRGLAVAHELAAKPHTALRFTREILIAPFRDLLHGQGLSHGMAGETLGIAAMRDELKP